MAADKPTPGCCVDFAFQRIGGKYKGRILWCIHESGLQRYGQLKKSISGITPKMLTQTLRELEQDKLVHRQVYLEVPPRVEYTLTDSGRKLIPFIDYLKQWVEELVEQDPTVDLHG
ncbi:winged helix-turn-helix transcriptional regulator [Hymenobacter metallicola]|uniref:Transcriptional regulator n=1 Tax=Hymenobacter metallicola TaxID=2563114 RepID=A0A4Z0PZ77_9BACT|nr:helix-turn-helix domain-containing protein [Hymenobacter metallicola]TGE22745.1 transcriptional regulator [Hymenobacter metallicola]